MNSKDFMNLGNARFDKMTKFVKNAEMQLFGQKTLKNKTRSTWRKKGRKKRGKLQWKCSLQSDLGWDLLQVGNHLF